MKEKKSSLRFKKREHSKVGIWSTVIGIVAWGIFIALSIYSSITNGNAEVIAGVIGILDAVFVLLGVFLGVKGLKEKDIYYKIPMIGMLLNATLFVVYFSLYMIGIAVR